MRTLKLVMLKAARRDSEESLRGESGLEFRTDSPDGFEDYFTTHSVVRTAQLSLGHAIALRGGRALTTQHY